MHIEVGGLVCGWYTYIQENAPERHIESLCIEKTVSISIHYSALLCNLV